MAKTPMEERVDELEVEIVALKRLVTGLRQKLLESTTQKRPSFRTMAQHSCCPACGHRRILCADQVLDRNAGGTSAPMALAQTTWLNRPIGNSNSTLARRADIASGTHPS